MNSHRLLRPALFAAILTSLSSAGLLAQGAVGGGGVGTWGLAVPVPAGGIISESIQPNALNDMEVTEITRAQLQGSMIKAAKAVTEAQTALVRAALTVPSNAANITAKAQELANAELALATSRAETFANVIKGWKDLTPEKRRSIAQALGGGGGGGRGGG
jgi:hypothetical protein